MYAVIQFVKNLITPLRQHSSLKQMIWVILRNIPRYMAFMIELKTTKKQNKI